ncbi:MAG: efflux RND transporter periplasmic adaptor subunit [Robiginitalea sp.]|uniref:efflux RND transporter periplasmic adaptor subunit n=1 Tax=Robiginitalea sp. TaxID=1902411 RepID=UPI003C744577
MKKNILYIALAAVGGMLAGYLFFGDAFEKSGIKEDNHTHQAEEGQMWTCSMHPQIMQPEAGDCPICGMDLIPAESGADGLAPGQFRMSNNALALADVQTTRVGALASGTHALKLSGTIQENEKAIGTQAAYFEGRIEELFVNFEGEEVRSGQKLATLYAPELVSAQQELITASGLKTAQPELYRAVRNKLKLWKLSEKQISEIEASGRVQEYFPIYATVSGTVSEIMVQAGDYVKKGMPLFKIANLGSVWAVFDAYENQVSLLKEGQLMVITAKSYPNEPLQAKISFINPILNASTRTVEVRAVVQNPGGKLKPGMFVTGDLALSKSGKDQALVIPESAVLWTGERSVVYVKIDPNAPVFEMREIRVSDGGNGKYTVLSGLENGEEIVTQGTFTLDAAAQLKGKKSMMHDGSGPAPTGHEGHLNSSRANPAETESSFEERTFSKAFTMEMAAVIPTYLKMKDALVAGDAPVIKEEARQLVRELSAIPTTGLGADEKSALSTSQSPLKAIADSDLLETQRNHFVRLNEVLIPIMERAGGGSQTLYVQTCPMADNNKGAAWMSAQKEIRNPYYGDAMLTCGRVIRTIQ